MGLALVLVARIRVDVGLADCVTVSAAEVLLPLLMVLAPPKVCAPVLTRPGFVASAGPNVIVEPLMEAPLVWELPENVPTVVTPPPAPAQLPKTS